LIRSRRSVALPDALTPAAVAVCAWVAAASAQASTGIVPALLAALLFVADYLVWRARGKPWHDPTVLVLLLPALACGLWIGVGGLVAGVHRGSPGRLLLEVGPGLALTGLACTLVSYHGRHRP
jgi:hypothetical protein